MKPKGTWRHPGYPVIVYLRTKDAEELARGTCSLHAANCAVEALSRYKRSRRRRRHQETPQ